MNRRVLSSAPLVDRVDQLSRSICGIAALSSLVSWWQRPSPGYRAGAIAVSVGLAWATYRGDRKTCTVLVAQYRQDRHASGLMLVVGFSATLLPTQRIGYVIEGTSRLSGPMAGTWVFDCRCGIADPARQRCSPVCQHDSRPTVRVALVGTARPRDLWRPCAHVAALNGVVHRRHGPEGAMVPVISDRRRLSTLNDWSRTFTAIIAKRQIDTVVLVIGVRSLFICRPTTRLRSCRRRVRLTWCWTTRPRGPRAVCRRERVVLRQRQPHPPRSEGLHERQTPFTVADSGIETPSTARCVSRWRRIWCCPHVSRRVGPNTAEKLNASGVRYTPYLCDLEAGTCSTFKGNASCIAYRSHLLLRGRHHRQELNRD